MGFIYGIEKKKFEEKWETLRKEYEAAGMTEEAIQEMYKFDLEAFNRRRTDMKHEQLVTNATFDDGEETEYNSPLFLKFMPNLSSCDEYSFGFGRYAWIESIDEKRLYVKLKKLEEKDIELLTMLAIEGYSRREIAAIWGVSEQAIGKRIKKIRRFLFSV